MNKHRETVFNIWNEYNTQGWKMPAKWLIDVDVFHGLIMLPPVDPFAPKMDKMNKFSLCGIPIEVGSYSFGIATIVDDYHQCRVGDFVEYGTLPTMGDDTHTYFDYQPTPAFSWLAEPMPESVELPPRWRFEKQKFILDKRLFYLWRRIQ